MDIVSPPDVIEEIVTDLDVAFLNGIRSLTLRGTDNYSFSEREIVIEMGEPTEFISMNRAQVLWFSTRSRTIRRPVKKEKPLG